MTLDQYFAEVPASMLKNINGAAVTSGRRSFREPGPVMIMCLNPGGNPADDTHRDLTLAADINLLQNHYCDDYLGFRDGYLDPVGQTWRRWRNAARVMRLIQQLGLDPGRVAGAVRDLAAVARHRRSAQGAGCEF